MHNAFSVLRPALLSYATHKPRRCQLDAGDTDKWRRTHGDSESHLGVSGDAKSEYYV